MPRRSELGWILVMVVVAVTLGFFIGGGPSLLSGTGDDGVLSSSPAVATQDTTSTTAASETTTTATPAAARAPSEVSVRVANGSSTAGQAVRVGARLAAAGYKVLPPAPSTPDPVGKSVVQFTGDNEADAAALAALLGLPASAAAETSGDLGPANLSLVVGDDLKLSP